MKLPILQIDAFADAPFAGNPAAVMPLDAWLDDATLQRIAEENNVSETAFFLPDATGEADPPSLMRTELPFGPFLAIAASFYLFAEPWIHVNFHLPGG